LDVVLKVTTNNCESCYVGEVQQCFVKSDT